VSLAWDRNALLALPMFAAQRAVLARLPEARFPTRDDLNALAGEALRSGGGAAIRFVPPGPPPREVAEQYEVRIYRRGEVQTREENRHDLFNALVWLGFPRTKAVINRHHFEQMRARRGEARRGTARDVLTLFDEGGIVAACGDPRLAALLAAFQWKELFWERRAQVLRAVRFFVFGHAILEKALEPYKGVTAKALIIDVDEAFLSAPPDAQLGTVDARAADYFADSRSLASTRSLSPLPILGIPGWSADNESETYYEDAEQFRPGRRAGK